MLIHSSAGLGSLDLSLPVNTLALSVGRLVSIVPAASAPRARSFDVASLDLVVSPSYRPAYMRMRICILYAYAHVRCILISIVA